MMTMQCFSQIGLLTILSTCVSVCLWWFHECECHLLDEYVYFVNSLQEERVPRIRDVHHDQLLLVSPLYVTRSHDEI